ncbi:MAG: DUF47 family protein, partial [Eggerthellaceae bacterium]|nr:DUF47 family protein [Eggerthellaceae bacterium]
MARIKKKLDYFEAFKNQAELACRGIDLLAHVIDNFDDESDLIQAIKDAEKIEHDGDSIAHAVFEALAIDFMTPIDREDIITLTQHLDDVLDSIEGTIQRLYMLNVQHMRPEISEFVKLLQKSTKALETALDEFENFKKSKDIRKLIVDVSDVEEEADALFFKAMRELHTTETDPIAIYTWSSIFQRLENAADAC